MCVDVNLVQPTGRVITRERDCRRACKRITKCAAYHYNHNDQMCNLYKVNGVGNASVTMCVKVPPASISRGRRFSCERNMGKFSSEGVTIHILTVVVV